MSVGIRLGIIIFVGLLWSCEKSYSPKPKGYNRIDLPTPTYEWIKDEHPYTFQHNKASIVFDDTFNLYEPHWVHVYYPDFQANIQITYKNVKQDKKKFQELVNDALKLANRHQIKAYAIEESMIRTPSGKAACVIELTGDVPSHFQFYITDTTENFLRGALYFPVANKNDSLAPVIEYVKKDVIHLLNTLDWRKM